VSAPDLVVAVLAAGGSSRLGQAKQLVRLRGVPVVRRQCLCALAAGVGDVVVVLGSDQQRHRAVLTDLELEVIVNEEWAEGLASTLRCAVRAAQRRRAALLVLPCDQYRIVLDDLRTLHSRWRAAPSNPCVSVWDDYVGPPAILPLEFFERVLQLRGDVGARSLLSGPAAATTGRMANPRAPFDLDAPADLTLAQAWQAPS
jgi:molybdenum cofactor cytidylyltransferase